MSEINATNENGSTIVKSVKLMSLMKMVAYS